MKNIAILGSTGSIGTQTLDVISRYAKELRVSSLVAYSNYGKLEQQVAAFAPDYHALISVDGESCLIEAVKNCDLAVVATRGICAIDSILYCLEHGIDVALANKEALVCAGGLIMSKLKQSGSRLFPVDSEHFAISQCLLGRRREDVSKILLTASGGPFWETDKELLKNVTSTDALKHPNWNMGEKITIDSATMMNKALEVIEARWLFDLQPSQIRIIVHRQSIVHSMVEFANGSVMAQLARPDMRIPIQYALLGEPGKKCVESLNFDKFTSLTFESCNFDKFPCSKLGYDIFNYPALCSTVMNAANDVCVESFLQGRLSFADFYNIIVRTVERFSAVAATLEVNVENIKLYDKYAREYSKKLIDGEIC